MSANGQLGGFKKEKKKKNHLSVCWKEAPKQSYSVKGNF